MSIFEQLLIAILVEIIMCLCIYIGVTHENGKNDSVPDKEIDCLRWLSIVGRKLD